MLRTTCRHGCLAARLDFSADSVAAWPKPFSSCLQLVESQPLVLRPAAKAEYYEVNWLPLAPRLP